MFSTQVEDTPDSRFRGVVLFNGVKVFADPDTHDRPVEALTSIERLFATHVGKLVTQSVAEGQQELFDSMRGDRGSADPNWPTSLAFITVVICLTVILLAVIR